jgi:hypothetical protein
MELTGKRRSILVGAWWTVLVCGMWLAVVWDHAAYRLVFVCDPSYVQNADAGSEATLAMGLLAILASTYALIRFTIGAHALAAFVLLFALPTRLVEWIIMKGRITDGCGVRMVWKSWIAAPTRDAVVVISLAGPLLLILRFLLQEFEEARGARPQIPTARARCRDGTRGHANASS